MGLVLPRVAADGALRTVGLIGTRLDPQEEIAIQLQTTAEKAVWRELWESPSAAKPVPGRLEIGN